MSIRLAGTDINLRNAGKALLVGGGVGAAATALAHLINLPRKEQEMVLEVAAENDVDATDVIRNALLTGGTGAALYLSGVLDDDEDVEGIESMIRQQSLIDAEDNRDSMRRVRRKS